MIVFCEELNVSLGLPKEFLYYLYCLEVQLLPFFCCFRSHTESGARESCVKDYGSLCASQFVNAVEAQLCPKTAL